MPKLPIPVEVDDDPTEHACADAPPMELQRLEEVEARARHTLRLLEKRMGFELRAANPGGQPPRLPPRVTTMASREIADLYARFAAWSEYVGDELALARVVRIALQEEVTQANAAARLQHKHAPKAIVACEVVRKALVLAEARVEFLQPKLELWKQAIHVLSREQTRRDAEVDHSGPRRT